MIQLEEIEVVEEKREALSLIERVRRMAAPMEEPEAPVQGGKITATLPDGYVRRSPIQPYHESASYRRRQKLIAVSVVLVIVLAGIAASVLL